MLHTTRPGRQARSAISLFVAFAAIAGCSDGASDPPDPPPQDSPPALAPVEPGPRALIVNELDALSAITMRRVLDRLADSAGSTLDADAMYARWWDALNTSNGPPGAGPGPSSSHCDESTPPGTINGFPITCPRGEGTFPGLGALAHYRAVAAVNRLDLAPGDGAHCGEVRLVLALPPERFTEHMVIFEALYPNPQPELGRLGCSPIAAFWSGMEDPALDAAAVGDRLEDFFFHGVDDLPPVIDAAHLGLSSDGGATGRIRSNTLANTWQLREFVLASTCEGTCQLDVVPTTVGQTAFAPLLLGDDPRSALLEDALVEQIPSLVSRDVDDWSLDLPDATLAGESNAQVLVDQPEERYGVFAADNDALRIRLAARLSEMGSPVTERDLLARATATTCAGCHALSSGEPMGDGVTFPRSLGFVHVDHRGELSPALRDVFLPARRQLLDGFLGSL